MEYFIYSFIATVFFPVFFHGAINYILVHLFGPFGLSVPINAGAYRLKSVYCSSCKFVHTLIKNHKFFTCTYWHFVSIRCISLFKYKLFSPRADFLGLRILFSFFFFLHMRMIMNTKQMSKSGQVTNPRREQNKTTLNLKKI